MFLGKPIEISFGVMVLLVHDCICLSVAVLLVPCRLVYGVFMGFIGSGQSLGALVVCFLFFGEGLLFTAAVKGDVADVFGSSPRVVVLIRDGTCLDLVDSGLHFPEVGLEWLDEGGQFGEQVICWGQLRGRLRCRWGIDSSQGGFWLSLLHMPG